MPFTTKTKLKLKKLFSYKIRFWQKKCKAMKNSYKKKKN